MTKKQKEQIKRQVEFYFSLVNVSTYFYVHYCSAEAQREIQKIVRNEQGTQASDASEVAEQMQDK